MARNTVIGALDIGSSKICCFIATHDGESGPRVIGIGHQASRGVRAGGIVDMTAAEESILAAVHTAERMADETLREVVVGFSGGAPASRIVNLKTGVNGGPVRDADLRRLLYGGGTLENSLDRTVLHALPIGYSIDGSNGIRDPRGMHGQTLAVHLHEVTVAAGATRNLTTCVERCHLGVSDVVTNPYASGIACLVPDEMELGVTVIDMGGGTTSIAVFAEGAPALVDSIPVGGSHVTSDIARGLATPLAHAERLKTLHGSALPSPSDERETVTAPQVGEDESGERSQLPKSFLVSIVAPRIEETFELVRERLRAAGMENAAGRRAVLTGGASQLPGVPEVAAQILDKQVRLGRPTRIDGLAAATNGPAFSACAGLLRLAAGQTRDIRLTGHRRSGMGNGFLSRFGPIGRIGDWLSDNL